MMHRNAAMSSHKKRPSSRFHLALSALVLTAAARTARAQEEIYYEPRSAVIHDGLINKPTNVCPVSYGGIEASKTFPWTHNPTCVDVTADGASKTFCAYTNAGYNNGRGISFVVTPEVAASVSMDTFGMGIGGLEGQVGEETGMWEVRDAGVKGKGLFAKKDIGAIFAGESLIVQTPVLFVAKDVLDDSSIAKTQRVLEKAMEQLPEKSRMLVKKLSGNKDGSAEDIVTTNSIGVKWPWVDEIPELLSVTPEIARINHACRPNTLWRFSDYTLTFDVFALREIKPGEEITRSYGYEKRPHRRRVMSLEANCGFTCACPLCTASDEEIMASNDRLSEIKALKSVMPTDETDAPRFLELLPSLIKHLEEEGLIAELPGYEETLAYTWSMFGKEDEARYWAGRAQKHWAVIAGKESWEQRRCGDMERDVKSHKTWKSWKGEPLDGKKEDEDEDEDED